MCVRCMGEGYMVNRVRDRLSDSCSAGRQPCHVGSPEGLRYWRTKNAVARLAARLLRVATRGAQAVGGAEKARPVAGDPGISSMVVMEQPEFRVLRDYAEPGATRRMHSHDDATWHVLTLVTGQLKFTIEGEAAIDVTQG